MAVGDIYSDLVQINDDGTQNIQPASGQEVVIHNIGWSTAGADIPAVKIYRKDGAGAQQMADEKTFAQLNFQYGYILGAWHLNNSDYMQIENISGSSTAYVWWDGIETKTA